MKFPQIFLLILFLSSCSIFNHNNGTNETSAQGISLKVQKFTLDNGLRILVHENPRLPIFSYYTFYEIGSRFEHKGVTGSTHFLEHMMFKGSKNHGPSAFDTLTFANGGMSNAYTTYDRTVYYQSLPSSKLEEIIELESDRVKNLSLDESLLENERQVILEERKLRLENKASSKLYTAMMSALYEGTPYAGPVIGSERDISGATSSDLLDFLKRFYVPNNMVIVIAGDVKAEQVFELIKKKFGDIQSRPEVEIEKNQLDRPELYSFKGRYNRTLRVHGSVPSPVFNYYFKGFPIGSRKAYVADIVGSMISGGGAYLNEKLVNSRHPKLTSIYAQNMSLRRSGSFIVGGTLYPKSGIKTVKLLVERELVQACKAGINQRELSKTLNNYLVSYYRSIQSNSGIASIIGAGESIFGDYNQYLKDIAEYRSITIDEARDVCLEMFKPENGIFGTVWEKHPKN